MMPFDCEVALRCHKLDVRIVRDMELRRLHQGDQLDVRLVVAVDVADVHGLAIAGPIQAVKDSVEPRLQTVRAHSAAKRSPACLSQTGYGSCDAL